MRGPSPRIIQLMGERCLMFVSIQFLSFDSFVFHQTVDEYVKQADQAEQCRKEIQHKRWTERVSDPLQKAIEKYIDNQSSEDIEKRRRRLLAQYLRYCNKKVKF